MSQIEIRQVSADDHAAWLALWQAYLRFYNTELPEAVTTSTWQRFLDPSEPTHAALALGNQYGEAGGEDALPGALGDSIRQFGVVEAQVGLP